jgi:hypothetical protein
MAKIFGEELSEDEEMLAYDLGLDEFFEEE